MKKLILINSLLFLASCMSINRIERNCDKFTQICGTEKETVIEIRDTTIYQTDTVTVYLPQDTVEITDTVLIKDNLAFLPTIHKEFGLIAVDAGVYRSILNVSAYLNDSTFLYSEPDTIFIPSAIKEYKITEKVPVRYIPGWHRFASIVVITQLVFVALFTGRQILKAKRKI